MDGFSTGLMAYYAVAIGIAGLVFIIIFIMAFLKKFSLRCIIHFGWCIFYLWTVIGFLFSFILAILAYHTVSAC